MRIKDVNEGPISALKNVGKKFQQDVAKGFMRTQKGGSLAPDALEKGIKKFFTNVEKYPKPDTPDTKPQKGGKGPDDALKLQRLMLKK